MSHLISWNPVKLVCMNNDKKLFDNLRGQITELILILAPEFKKVLFLDKDKTLLNIPKKPESTYFQRYDEAKENLEKEYIKKKQPYFKIQSGLTGIRFCPVCKKTISNDLIVLKYPVLNKEVLFSALEFHEITEHSRLIDSNQTNEKLFQTSERLKIAKSILIDRKISKNGNNNTKEYFKN